MKITFIKPNMTAGRSADALPPLGIAALSGYTPPGVEKELYDECIEKIPSDLDTDLAAISVHTFSARRSYEIADSLRSRGIPVVMGGYHPTLIPGEALEHADAVVKLSLIHISEPTRQAEISYAVFCLKKKKKQK